MANIFKRIFGGDAKKRVVELEGEIAELKKIMEGAGAEGNTPGSVLESFRVEVKEKEERLVVLEAEVQKNRGRIEELEDDLDDTSEDLKKTKKKLEETKSEKNALENQYDEIKTEHTKVREEFESTKTNLAITESDLKVKKSSINFVNEILNAKGVSNTRTVEITQKTDEIRYFVDDSVCEIFREVYEDGKKIADSLSNEIWKWANLQKKTWLQDKVIIAFIGEFSAGKTSIVNRIFTHDDPNPAYTLPTDRAATTAVATYISFGESAHVHFTDPIGELRELSRDVFLQFTKESLDNISVSRLVSHFVTEYTNTNLARLSILDTPGFSSGDPEDEARTTAVIHEADAVFWVVDANAGDINTKSLSVIQEHIADIPLYIVINKVDSKSPGERDAIEKKMRSTIQKAQIPIQGCIQFSKKEPLDALGSVIDRLFPRNPDYDVIADIQESFDTVAKHYKKEIAEVKKVIQKSNREISEAESVIEAFDKKFARQYNKFQELTDELFSGDNQTFWGSGVKNDVVKAIFNKMVDVVKKMLDLHSELGDAQESRAFALSAKGNAENAQTENKEKEKRLQSVKTEFLKKLEAYNTIRG